MNIYGAWGELLKILGPLLLELADRVSDPPADYEGIRSTPKGNQYTIRKIPGFVPFSWSITLDIPAHGTVVFVRDQKFDSADEMDRLIRHEQRHVDQWAELGWPEFVGKYASNSGRRYLEADGYSENVDWQVQNNMDELPIPDIDKLTYWLMYYAAQIDQSYHIRGSGIRAAYIDLSEFVKARFGYQPLGWQSVAKWRDYFRNK